MDDGRERHFATFKPVSRCALKFKGDVSTLASRGGRSAEGCQRTGAWPSPLVQGQEVLDRHMKMSGFRAREHFQGEGGTAGPCLQRHR